MSECSLEIIRIGSTDILLEDLGEGRGKIIVSGYEYGAFNHYWGSMGKSSLKDFIARIDSHYFVKKLCNESDVFCPKKTVKAIRKYIGEELKYELPWYKWMDAQKSLRQEIRKLEGINSMELFFYELDNLSGNVNCDSLNWEDDNKFRVFIDECINDDACNFIHTKPSKQALWLIQIHKELKLIIKAEEVAK